MIPNYTWDPDDASPPGISPPDQFLGRDGPNGQSDTVA